MEETARNGTFDGNYGGATHYGSTASLTANAAGPATSRFSEAHGSTSSEGDQVSQENEATTTGAAGGAAAGQPQAYKPPFYLRPWFIVTSLVVGALGLALLFIILYPVVKAIAQLVVDRSVLNIDVAMITSPQNDSFALGLQGVVTHTGIFAASIKFTEIINITWREDATTNTPLGYMTLKELSAHHKRAYVNQTTQFVIQDQDAFGRFAAHLITAENFTWNLKSDNLVVQAVKFPVDHGIHFNKDLTMPGINNFNGNVILKDLQLPSDNPEGGINFIATTELNNPSPFQLDLGTVNFGLTYNSVYLGQGTGTNTKIASGPNDITLSGVLIPQSGAQNLSEISQLFTNYINGDNSPVIAKGISTVQDDGTEITWLSIALQSLILDVPFKPLAPLNPIRTINIGELGLTFTEATAWSPSAVSNSVQASLELPFGFGLSISEIQNDFNISSNGSMVAGLSTPIGASQSAIQVLNSTRTTGQINITIADTSLTCPLASHPNFAAFNAELTDSMITEFQLAGNSKAVANMSIGQITLDPIRVNVTTGLWGLKGLQGGLTIIKSVDVMGGTTDAITLNIDTGIYNPSSLVLATGDLTLQLFRQSADLGTALLPNLSLAMGNNTVTAIGSFTPNNSPLGLQTLNEFVGGKDVNLDIAGYDQSTNVASLLQAFETLNISVVLPGLNASLLSSAALEVLPTTGITNNMTEVTVNLMNPFTSALDITHVTSSVTSHGIHLGTIDTATNFSAAGKTGTTSPNLGLDLNFDPAALFTLTRVLAVDAGEDTAQLDGIVKLGGYSYISATTADAPPKKRKVTPREKTRRDNIYAGFNLPNFVDTAFKDLRSDVELQAAVTIGQYQTTLNYTQLSVPIITDSSLNNILPVLARPIVQKIVDGTVIGIDTVVISSPEPNQFGTQLKGSITNAGPFDAIISFPQGLTVSWSGSSLGSLMMSDVNVVGDVGAQLNSQSTFSVSDVSHLTDFTKTLLTQEEFEWDISAENITVSALGISVTNISLPTKKVTLKGMNGLKNGVTIQSFDLPANDPAGGIHLTLQTTVANPSQIGVLLPSLEFNAFFETTGLGPIASTEAVNLLPLTTSALPLAGRLVPQTSDSGLAAVSTVFNNFIHGENSNVTVQGVAAGSSSVVWLNEGIQALEVATVLPNQGKQNIIKSIDLEQLSLMFTEPTEWGPATSTNNTLAAFTLPFTFPVNIVAIAQNITTGFDGQEFAELAVPQGPAITDVVSRIIHLQFSNIPFAVFGNAHDVFSKFVAATTTGNEQTLSLTGAANAQANTGVGILSLQDIEFSVDSTIAGLQGLDAQPASVSNLDVASGTPEFLLITVDTALFNPSNLTIGTGDVSFELQFQGATIGSALINGLIIVPGNASYATSVHYSPQGPAVAQGQQLLENYIQGINSDTTIQGSTSSTPIESLQEALSQIKLTPVIIPALHQLLIPSASLDFPINIVQTGIAQASFVLQNPFTASISILELTAIATFNGLTLGKINQVDRSSDPITASGHQNITSPSLPLNFNLDPVTIVTMIADTAKANNVDLGPLAQLFQIVISNPNFQSPISSSVDTGPAVCVSGEQFDVDDAILNALKGLKVDLAIESSVKLDEYATDLTFNQSGVAAITDGTALYLIGAVAAPIVQNLVDGADLKFTQANITNISEGGFDLALAGSLTNIGPLDAKISFPEPVVISWQGNNIATISLPPVCAGANTGVPNYAPQATLQITNLDQFTNFAVFLLHNPSFTWTISTDKLQVEALGTIFNNVSLTKDISLAAFNGLPGVTISNFVLPSDDPAGGIHIETDANIPSPSQLGIDLGTPLFLAYFENVEVGPLTGSNLILAANANTTTHLTGRIIPQSGSDLDTIGQLFTEYLQADNIALVAKGESVTPTGSSAPVSWLSTAFKTLSLNVILSGQKFEIIKSIDISDFSVTVTTSDEAYSPLAGSNSTLAEYANPFGFSLQVVQSAVDMIVGLANNGTQIGSLNLPTSNTVGGVSTGNEADLPIAFHSIPFQSLNDGAMQTLFQEVTDTAQAEVTLQGTANVTAKTTIGNVPIGGIGFNVPSILKGINSFGKTAQLTNVSITGSGGNGGNQFIVSPLTTTLQNPSNVSLQTNDVALPVIYQGTQLGRAAISPFNLAPGQNTIPTDFHYYPDDANDTVAQSFLTRFLQTADNIPLTVQGDTASSPYGSLQPALEGVQLATSIAAIDSKPIIVSVAVSIPISALIDNLVDVSFEVYNSLNADFVIKHVQADASVDGQVFARFSQDFDSFIVPPGQTVSSGQFGNVLLTQGAIASLGIIPLGYLDIASAATAQVGQGGYELPWLHLNQLHVPTTYDITLGLSGLKQMASTINATSSTTSGSSSPSGSSTGSGAGSTSDGLSSPSSFSPSTSSGASVSSTPSKTPAPSSLNKPTSSAPGALAPKSSSQTGGLPISLW